MKADYQPARRVLLPILLCLLCLVALAPVARAQEFDEHGRWINGIAEPWLFRSKRYTEGAAASARAKWRQIGAAARDGSEWAGDYVLGGGVSESLSIYYLRWSPQSGYVFMSVYTCESNVTGFSYGGAAASPTLVELFPENLKQITRGFRSSEGHSHETTLKFSRFLPVKWGGGHYLVPEDQIAAFGDYAAGLGKFNRASGGLSEVWVDFFSKFGEAPAELAATTPIVPPGYERFVKRPIEAEITSVGARVVKSRRTSDGSTDYESLTTVTINAGRSRGVRRGMVFHVPESDQNETVEIRSVGRDSSVGIIIRDLGDGKGETYIDWGNGNQVKPYPAIVTGWRLTTSPHHRKYE